MTDESLSVLLELTSTRAAQLPALQELGVLARIDATFAPVPLAGSERGGRIPDTLVVRADMARSAIARVRAQPHVVGVWADPQVVPVPADDVAAAIDCTPQLSTGSAAEVARAVGADRVWQASGFRGDGVVVGIVDGGVDGARFPVAGGWSPDPASPPGHARVAWAGHGNMCAFDASIACPQVRFFDYSIGKTAPGAGIGGLLSSALQAFQRALTQFKADATPQVLSNSWGLYQVAWDPFPPGDPSNYTHNPQHVFTRKLVELLDAGILVTFAAGNCGGV